MKRHQGITIVELLAILVIIGILAAIAVPSVNRLIENTRARADAADVITLNQVTRLFQLNQLGYPKEDIFEGFSDDFERQTALVEAGYLSRLITPRISGESYQWIVDDQVWVYSGFVQSTSSAAPIVFSQTTTEEFKASAQTNSIFNEVDEGFEGRNGLLYIDNPRETYTITVDAQLSEGTNGGWGVLIEASLQESNGGYNDTGLILQFDRGLNGLAIRPRTNGGEGNTIFTLSAANSPFIEDRNSNPSWWTQRHSLRLEVSLGGPANEKILDVYINDNLVIDGWAFTSTVASSQNFTGLRSWTTPTIYYSLLIEP